MGTENYKIGLSKVLFKAGILGSLQEPRDAVTEKLLQLMLRDPHTDTETDKGS